ncbi:hypothetical protein OG535_09710 [Kitasatospora sp. NBC_00085]|uniref:hypothetical protein n=1 Tax=unclassified Kitasatospora TaxID=2633591 RepID=UPI003244B3FD
MTSFLTHRRLVHDGGLPVHLRHAALRTCLARFAPYGLRATYHHLTLSARMPRRLEADPPALVRAVEELHEARVLRLAQSERYAARRRAEKGAGRRAVTGPPAWWEASWWDSPNDAWLHDPTCHPPLTLPEYVRRQGALLDGAALAGCPACGDERPAALRSTGHGFVEACRACARVLRPCPCGRRHRVDPVAGAGWAGVRRRDHMTDAGTPNPHWPGPAAASSLLGRRADGRLRLCEPGR